MSEVQNKCTASLVLGIVSLLAWLYPLLGFPVSIVGLVLGVKNKYTAGMVLNAIGLVLTVVCVLIVVVVMVERSKRGW